MLVHDLAQHILQLASDVFHIDELTDVYATLQQQIGFDTIKGDASTGWLRLAALAVSLAALAALLINRRLPA